MTSSNLRVWTFWWGLYSWHCWWHHGRDNDLAFWEQLLAAGVGEHVKTIQQHKYNHWPECFASCFVQLFFGFAPGENIISFRTVSIILYWILYIHRLTTLIPIQHFNSKYEVNFSISGVVTIMNYVSRSDMMASHPSWSPFGGMLCYVLLNQAPNAISHYQQSNHALTRMATLRITDRKPSGLINEPHSATPFKSSG
jgi:hypothetical protein